MNRPKNDPGFGLYIHWPFCAAKCPYCDFNSHVAKNIDYELWQNAYIQEIESWARNQSDNKELTSIFFGGGTPSLMPVKTITAIIEKISDYWSLENVEITLEANPTSVDAARFSGYRAAGVNRISMGFQALNDIDLRSLGRLHTVTESLRALDIARSHFSRVSFDLIYARQNQTFMDWQDELDQALKLEPDHISLYQLTIEDGTRFGDMYKRGNLRGLPDDDLAHDMYAYTSMHLKKNGFDHYEVSNFAKPNQQSEHNLVYWRYGDYIGIGPGAHGRLNIDGRRVETSAHRNPQMWLQAVESNKATSTAYIPISEQAEECLLMGLRLEEGIPYQRLRKYSATIPIKERLDELTKDGFLWQTSDRFGATDKGRFVLNRLISELV